MTLDLQYKPTSTIMRLDYTLAMLQMQSVLLGDIGVDQVDAAGCTLDIAPIIRDQSTISQRSKSIAPLRRKFTSVVVGHAPHSP